MTTICYKDKVMASDGQSTMGDMIINKNIKKVFSINNCLVGFAGRMSSGLKFVSWFQKWSDAHMVQSEIPYVDILIPEDLTEDDFYAIVCWTDGTVSIYEGGQHMYEVDATNGVSIGSGSPYALSAMLAGCSAEEAVRIACEMDVFSGGELSIETLDPEPEELTLEKASEMSKEELIKLIFGEQKSENQEVTSESKVPSEVDENATIKLSTKRVILYSDFKVALKNPETGDIFEIIDLKDDGYLKGGFKFKKVVKEFKREYLDKVADEIGLKFEVEPTNKNELLDIILEYLANIGSDWV